MFSKLKPQQYIDEFYPCSGITTKTIINWIKRGKLKGEQTPTGRWLVVIEEERVTSNNVNTLVNMMQAAGL